MLIMSLPAVRVMMAGCPVVGRREKPLDAVVDVKNLGLLISTPFDVVRSKMASFSPKEDHTQTSVSDAPNPIEVGFAAGRTAFRTVASKPSSSAESTLI